MTAASGTLRSGSPTLTLRQRQVVSLAALGLTNRAIAGRLAITEEGVKSSMRLVLAKLGVATRTQAVIAAGRRGLLLPPDHLPARPVVHVRSVSPSRVAKADLRGVVARWQGQAPAGLIDELRGLLGDPVQEAS